VIDNQRAREINQNMTNDQPSSLNRRKFLAQASLIAGSVLLPVSAVHAAHKISNIGIQLYTLRDQLALDFEGTLAAIAKLGYSEVEFAGYYGRSPAEIKTILSDLNLSATASHIPIEVVESGFENAIETAVALGLSYLVVPYLAAQRRTSLDDYRKIATQFNVAGELAAKAGLLFAYHNHDFEFQTMDGKMPYDILLSDTDPDLVKMELDLFWIIKGGQDPVNYFSMHPGRFHLCHIKDMSNSGKMVDVGKGEIDFTEIFRHISKAGLRHFYVEHDRPNDSLASAAVSFQSVQNLRF
jgi:sugar phosphate isomerase/epimerase